MHQRYQKETGEMLTALYQTGFNKQNCPVCDCDYILATKIGSDLKLTCKKCGDVRLFNTYMMSSK
ncbi:hypothetical protein [Pectinatus cerevisiiphilus]|uniref:Uncharacterized protein n=1 Tax=Pectinatus cerevisiiphilus TaxID=86956 RepID=A0A4R3K823_9FIRM|nr:hypothetical protein [Pectinatus cerevisiiphilus]TCS79019.1 hypothetical protein EDC37_10878 [Pectinatus cerevisiiphilus]